MSTSTLRETGHRLRRCRPAAGLPDPARRRSTGKPLVYLDNAASSAQKPLAVIEAERDGVREVLREHPPRGPLALGRTRRTPTMKAREKTRAVSVNRLAESHEIMLPARHDGGGQPGRADLRAPRTSAPGDEILITGLEHHSNIVPWQMLVRQRRGRVLSVVPLDESGRRRPRRAFERMLTPSDEARRPWRIVSNALGTINCRVKRIDGARARGCGIPVFDGRRAGGPADARGGRAQRPRLRLLRVLEPQDLRADRRAACSTAATALLRGDASLAGRRRHDRGRSAFEKTTYNALPYKFEAGTPNIAGTHRPSARPWTT